MTVAIVEHAPALPLEWDTPLFRMAVSQLGQALPHADVSVAIAERLAVSEADLHLACALLGQGCQPETAAEILL